MFRFTGEGSSGDLRLGLVGASVWDSGGSMGRALTGLGPRIVLWRDGSFLCVNSSPTEVSTLAFCRVYGVLRQASPGCFSSRTERLGPPGILTQRLLTETLPALPGMAQSPRFLIPVFGEARWRRQSLPGTAFEGHAVPRGPD